MMWVEFYLFSCLFVFFLCFFKYFSKKLLALLVLEGLTIVMIFFFYKIYSSLCLSFMVIFLFSIMMVLDSVFGICLLVSSGRNSSLFLSNFNFC